VSGKRKRGGNSNPEQHGALPQRAQMQRQKQLGQQLQQQFAQQQ
jgi:peptide subunit release factor 1 (eRF1)